MVFSLFPQGDPGIQGYHGRKVRGRGREGRNPPSGNPGRAPAQLPQGQDSVACAHACLHTHLSSMSLIFLRSAGQEFVSPLEGGGGSERQGLRPSVAQPDLRPRWVSYRQPGSLCLYQGRPGSHWPPEGLVNGSRLPGPTLGRAPC